MTVKPGSMVQHRWDVYLGNENPRLKCLLSHEACLPKLFFFSGQPMSKGCWVNNMLLYILKMGGDAVA